MSFGDFCVSSSFYRLWLFFYITSARRISHVAQRKNTRCGCLFVGGEFSRLCEPKLREKAGFRACFSIFSALSKCFPLIGGCSVKLYVITILSAWIFIYFHFIFDSYQSFFSQLIYQNIFYLSLYIKSPTNGKLYVKRCFRLILF